MVFRRLHPSDPSANNKSKSVSFNCPHCTCHIGSSQDTCDAYDMFLIYIKFAVHKTVF